MQERENAGLLTIAEELERISKDEIKTHLVAI
jgi:hypothetical protein